MTIHRDSPPIDFDSMCLKTRQLARWWVNCEPPMLMRERTPRLSTPSSVEQIWSGSHWRAAHHLPHHHPPLVLVPSHQTLHLPSRVSVSHPLCPCWSLALRWTLSQRRRCTTSSYVRHHFLYAMMWMWRFTSLVSGLFSCIFCFLLSYFISMFWQLKNRVDTLTLSV